MSSEQAKAYHSITFGDKNTWDDWHLIPTSRPFVPPPSPDINEVSIPGMNGVIDLTELLTGYTTFGNRSGSFQFYVMDEYWPNWQTAYSTIMAYLNGKHMTMILDDDPGYFYDGRFTVSQWNSGKNVSSITITFSVHPYKQSLISSDEPWEWDPFSFVDGVIRQYGEIEVTDSYVLTMNCDPEPSIPVFIVSDMVGDTFEVEHAYNGETNVYTLEEGDNVFPDLKLLEGVNTLIFTGSAKVTVRYRGGRF